MVRPMDPNGFEIRSLLRSQLLNYGMFHTNTGSETFELLGNLPKRGELDTPGECEAAATRTPRMHINNENELPSFFNTRNAF